MAEASTGPDKVPRRELGRVWQKHGKWTATVRWMGRQKQRVPKENTKTAAQRLCRVLLRELEDEVKHGRVERIRFKKFAEEYVKTNRAVLAPRTIETYEAWINSRILPFFERMIVSKIRSQDVARFLKQQEGLKPATLNRLRAVVSAMMTQAVETGYAEANPVLRVKPIRNVEERAIPYLDHQTQDDLVQAAPDQLRPLVALALGSGLRLGEMLHLEWRDVDLDRGAVTVIKSKGKKPRTVLVTSDVVALLSELRSARAIPIEGPDRVFHWLPTKNTRYQTMYRKKWKLAAEAVGHPELRLHDLRHAYAVNLVRAGVPLTDVQKLLGHTSFEMTLRYAHHAPGNYAEQARAVLESLRGTTKGTKEGSGASSA